jgi:hypothetical protein
MRSKAMKHPMSIYGDVLTTREMGDRARNDVERAIAAITPGQVVALDFEGVRAVSVPFADAGLARLFSERAAGYYEDHPFVIINATEDVRETIGLALRHRRLIALALGGDGAKLLGADEVFTKTLEAALELDGEFSVGELAQLLHLSPQAANNRVRHLARSGVLQRERISQPRGGREFRYRVPVAA